MNGDPSGPSTRIHGLGSAHTGVRHWWLHRLTAVVLVPVGLWLVVSQLGLINAPHDAVRAWLASPGNAIAMLLFLGGGFLHLAFGLQVVVEDYVHDRRLSMPLLMLVPVACGILNLIGGFAVLHVAFTGQGGRAATTGSVPMTGQARTVYSFAPDARDCSRSHCLNTSIEASNNGL